jgi:hypothetical protein
VYCTVPVLALALVLVLCTAAITTGMITARTGLCCQALFVAWLMADADADADLSDVR